MNALVTGRRRQGKSTLARHLARQRTKAVIAFDPNRQFRSFFQVRDIEQLEDEMYSKDHLELSYVPSDESIDDEFSAFADVLWRYGNYSLIVDEAQRLQKGRYIHPKLDKLLRQGPTEKDYPETIHIIQTCHRPSDISTVGRSLCNDHFFFRITLQSDLDVIEEEDGTAARTAVEGLTENSYQLIHYSLDHDTVELWDNPKAWYSE